MRRARDLLARHDVTLLTIAGEHENTRASAAILGFDALSLPPPPPGEPSHRNVAVEGERQLVSVPIDEWPDAGLIVRRTLRSGQSLRHPGSVAVIGDVNPGAEIIAGGDIVVWGRLRGTVHAGALGNESAIVCALDLAPTQLRIAGRISRSPDDRRRKARPEFARVRDGQIIAEPWGL
jgi:septum site-determining protein MinC